MLVSLQRHERSIRNRFGELKSDWLSDVADNKKLTELMGIWQRLNIALNDIGCRFSAPNFKCLVSRFFYCQPRFYSCTMSSLAMMK